MTDGTLASSFRDPSGFLFRHEGRLYRQVNESYAENLALLHESGLYDQLTGQGLLIPHREAPLELARTASAHRILEPELIPFISYPYEWCFSQLKDAALATLEIQRLALKKGMSLKDASAYNIQFRGGAPVLIDSLSFEAYEEGRPWVAYGQFCRHFLAPLALMALRDVRLVSLLRTNIDGVPLDLACRLLPWRSRLSPGLFLHLYAHARSQKKHESSAAGDPAGQKGRTAGRAVSRSVSKNALLGILDSLRGAVRRLDWRPEGTEWGNYYEATNYSSSSLQQKRDLVARFLEQAGATTVWDLGANDGYFSRVATERGLFTLAVDGDFAAVEKGWRTVRGGGDPHLLPLLVDLTNPSPALGWAHAERMSLAERGPADMVFALALVHHLAISNNVPLGRLARTFAEAGRHLIIEFVPKSDSQVKRLLATREDIFPDYHEAGFNAAFGEVFDILETAPIPDSERTLYLMRRKA